MKRISPLTIVVFMLCILIYPQGYAAKAVWGFQTSGISVKDDGGTDTTETSPDSAVTSDQTAAQAPEVSDPMMQSPRTTSQAPEVSDPMMQSPRTTSQAPQETPKGTETKAQQSSQQKTITVTVGKGDTLWGYARKYLGDGSKYPEIVAANKDKYPGLAKNPDLIIDGWQLVIPVKETQPTSQAAKPTSSQSTSSSSTSSSNKPSSTSNTSSSGSGASTTTSSSTSNAKPEVTIPQWTTEQKIARLQKALDDMNRILAAQGKLVTALTTSTVRMMIDNKVLTEVEWMGLNPPEGHVWSVQGRTIKLTPGIENIKDDKTSDKTAADKKAADEKAAADKKAADEKAAADKAAADKKAADEKAAADKARTQYEKELAALGIPDLTSFKSQNEYLKAINAGMKILPASSTWQSSPFAPFLDGTQSIPMLQKILKDAQERYERKVNAKDVTNTIWPFDSDIKSAAEAVNKARANLTKAVNQLKSLYGEAKSKADAAQAELNKDEQSIKKLQADLDKLDKYNTANADKVYDLTKSIKEAEQRIKKNHEILDNFAVMKNVFKM